MVAKNGYNVCAAVWFPDYKEHYRCNVCFENADEVQEKEFYCVLVEGDDGGMLEEEPHVEVLILKVCFQLESRAYFFYTCARNVVSFRVLWEISRVVNFAK